MSELCADPLSLLLYWIGHSQDARCAPYLTWIVEQSPFDFVEYLQVFAKTMALEAAFYFYLLRGVRPLWKIPALLFFANLATHPMVYFGIPWICEKNGWTYSTLLIVAEVFAPAIEVLVLRYFAKTAWGATAFWIVAANLFSWWVGVLITYG